MSNINLSQTNVNLLSSSIEGSILIITYHERCILSYASNIKEQESEKRLLKK